MATVGTSCIQAAVNAVVVFLAPVPSLFAFLSICTSLGCVQTKEAQAERQQERQENLQTKKFRAQLKAAERAEAAKHKPKTESDAAGAATAPGKHRAGFEGRAGNKFINKS